MTTSCRNCHGNYFNGILLNLKKDILIYICMINKTYVFPCFRENTMYTIKYAECLRTRIYIAFQFHSYFFSIVDVLQTDLIPRQYHYRTSYSDITVMSSTPKTEVGKRLL